MCGLRSQQNPIIRTLVMDHMWLLVCFKDSRVLRAWQKHLEGEPVPYPALGDENPLILD